jgi:hypothetical protein
MLVFRNKGFIRKYAYGGRGLFDSIAGLFSRFFSSDAAKAITSSALDIGKKAAKEAGKRALDIGKETAIKAAPKLIEKGINKALTPKAKNILQKYNLQIDPKAVSTQLTTKAQDILDKYDINTLMMGSGTEGRCASNKQKPIEIQKLVKKLNSGGGMKII